MYINEFTKTIFNIYAFLKKCYNQLYSKYKCEKESKPWLFKLNDSTNSFLSRKGNMINYNMFKTSVLFSEFFVIVIQYHNMYNANYQDSEKVVFRSQKKRKHHRLLYAVKSQCSFRIGWIQNPQGATYNITGPEPNCIWWPG